MISRASLVAALALAAACGPRQGFDAAIDARVDATDTHADVRDVPDVPAVDPCRAGPCGATELCGPIVDGGIGVGNGVDDDCNGSVDEACRCDTNAISACFPGPADRRNVGACHDGSMICGELGIWGACTGAIAPRDEICDGIDNDCNGRVDDGLDGCTTSVACPAYASAQPLSDYVVTGASIAPNATTFAWRIECPPEIGTCPAPTDPNAPTLTVHLVQSGRYVVHLAVANADGAASSCDYPLYVAGGGMRIELDWDRKGGVASSGVDLDLHVAPLDVSRRVRPQWFTVDDCYYATCTAPGGRVSWSTSASDTRFAATGDVSVCRGAPAPYGDRWAAAGACWNPRLDTDDLACDPSITDATNPAFCFVEIINVDAPPSDVTFRVGVNFYRDHGTCTDGDPTNDIVHPRLLVHCNGALRAEIGGIDDGQVPMRCADNPSYGSTNWTWIAADVRFGANACGLSDCEVRPLIAGPNEYRSCDAITDADDVCADVSRRVFVRRAGARPIDAEFANSF